MSERAHARGEPQLKGDSLRELAGVLLALYPEGAEPNRAMATALAEAGRLVEARPHLEKALAVDRRNQQLLFLYARLLLDLGEKPAKVREVVDDLRRYFPRSRQKVEEYFAEASKGKMRFDADDVY
ncbi:MAG: tetratricopeptide repeat protein [Gemmatimonadetes bacterium]|nr:tetratricopeptide repeat protein [Gemmatimonadota bacterium]